MRKVIRTSAITIGCALALSTWPAFGQAVAPSTFEVASIKPADPTRPIAIRRSGNHFNTINTSLEFLITWAYDIHSERLYGKPKWLDLEHWDILANSSKEDWPEQIPLRSMMQALLAERFKLAVHRETRELPMYLLTVAKGGVKVPLREHSGDGPQNPFRMPGVGQLIGTEVTAEMLAKVLANQLGRSVQDGTGLKGVFDFKLEWAPETVQPMMAESMRSRASLFTAIEEQLGLKLEARKGPVEVVVIDHVENKPTEN